MRAHFAVGFKAHFVRAYRLSVQGKLHMMSVAVYQHVDILARHEIPVGRHDVQDVFLLRREPHALIEIVYVLREACGIHNTKVAVLGVVRGRFADIIKACPDELSTAEFAVPVKSPGLHRGSPPAHNAVIQRRALIVHPGERRHICRESVNSP